MIKMRKEIMISKKSGNPKLRIFSEYKSVCKFQDNIHKYTVQRPELLKEQSYIDSNFFKNVNITCNRELRVIFFGRKREQ